MERMGSSRWKEARTELQGAESNETFIGRREQEQGSCTSQKVRLITGRLISFRTWQGSDKLPN